MEKEIAFEQALAFALAYGVLVLMGIIYLASYWIPKIRKSLKPGVTKKA